MVDVGQRVSSVGRRGTVQYVGTLDGKPPDQTWIGVEWDNADDGKHDGEVKGRRYFQCRAGATGSFLLPDKIQPAVTFVEAFASRYCTEELESTENQENSPAQPHHAIATTQRQSALLREELIASAGAEGEVRACCPCLTELDLANNLLPDWQTVGSIVEQLPALASLNLSANCLLPLRQPPALGSLKILVLNSMVRKTSWAEIQQLEPSLPELEELHLVNNQIEDVAEAGGWAKLRMLNLERNGLESWKQVESFRRLPSLERLLLNQNKIGHINQAAPTDFSQLKSLSISSNLIGDWSSVDALNTYISLSELRFQSNMLTDDLSPSKARAITIARLAAVVKLNGADVRSQERLHAERMYCQLVMADESCKAEDRYRLHPRFDGLVEQHQVSKDDRANAPEQRCMSDSLLSVTISSRASASVGTKPIQKKLTPSMTVLETKLLCQQAFKLNTAEQRLFFLQEEAEEFPEELGDDSRQLDFYGVQTGGTIIMCELEKSHSS